MVRHSDVNEGEGGAVLQEEVFLVVVKRHAAGDELVEVFFGRLRAGRCDRGRRGQGSRTRLSVGLVGRWWRRGRAEPGEEAFLGVG